MPDRVRSARSDADRERSVLFALTKRRDQDARTRRALAPITQGLRDRQAFLARAHAARVAALSGVRSNRRKAEKELRSLLAARARAAVLNVGPGGPWAIVQCESGGQNLPPTTRRATTSSWSPPARAGRLDAAGLPASKAELDRLAAKL